MNRTAASTAFILISSFLLAADVSGEAPETRPLLKTHWWQDGPFARFSPKNERLGCWSTAYAQILFFHQLRPTGRVRYDCASGEKIDIDLSKCDFDFSRFPTAIVAGTPASESEQAALYSFATAVVVRKDFGTGRYKRLLNSVDDLEKHYAVDAKIYVSLGDKVPMDRAEIEAKLRSENATNIIDRAGIINLLQSELAARRPVYLHFSNIKDFGHSVVIDAIRKEGDRQMVHLNYGAVEAEMNNWYDLFAPINQPDDTTLRAFVTIKPR